MDPPTKGRGRGVVRGRGRGTPVRSRPLPRTTRVWTRESALVDHRPRRIGVGEITTEEKEDIKEQIKVNTMKIFINTFQSSSESMLLRSIVVSGERRAHLTCPKDGLQFTFTT